MIPRIKRILYTTDLSKNSAYAFRYAVNSAKNHNAKIIILYVVEIPPRVSRALVDDYAGEEKRKELFDKRVADTVERIKKRLHLFCDREFLEEPECTDMVESIEVCVGYPAEEILKKAEELDCDAIIMGTHGKGIISQTFLGSVVKRVLRRVRKPVYIIPLPEGDTDISFKEI